MTPMADSRANARSASPNVTLLKPQYFLTGMNPKILLTIRPPQNCYETHFIKLLGHQKSNAPALLFCGLPYHTELVLDVWHKSHEPCTLDGTCKIALLLRSEACTASTHHASVWIYVCTKTSDIFVVDMLDSGLLV